MADLRATPYANPLTGLSNDVIQGLLGYMKDKQRTQQMQGLASLLESTGIPKTVERAAYAESPTGLLNALTNVNRANVPLLKPETADALMTLAPVPSGANKAAMAAGRAGERYAEKVVPQILERGGLPAGLLQDLAQGTKSQIFIGPFSKSFDKDAAITAFQLEKKGVSPQEIWQKTGTVRGPDGQWRQEISDMASSIKGDNPFEDVIMGAYQRGAADTGNQLYKTTVEDVFMHNPLKEAYPEIMGIETQMMRKGANTNVRGSLLEDALSKEQILQVRKDLNPQEARSTMLHELQHAVQESEGFAAGGNKETMQELIDAAKNRQAVIESSDEFKEANKLNNELWDKFFTQNANIEDLKIAEQELKNKYPILQEQMDAARTVRLLGDDPYNAYSRLMGEAEARLVQTRQNLSKAERKEFFPFEFQDEKLNPYGLDVSPESLINLDTRGNLVEKGLLGEKASEYRGSHTAPSPDFGAPLHDLTGGGQMYPADVYSSKAAQYYGTGYPKADKEAFDLAKKVRGNPDAEVTMYRAVPKDENIKTINAGDWVTLSKDYAKTHGESALQGDYKIISQKVKAKDLWTNADSIHEFGYHPQEDKLLRSLLE